MKPRKKAAKKRVVKKSSARKAVRLRRPPAPPSVTEMRLAIPPEVFLEMLRERGLIFTLHDAKSCVRVQFYDRGGLNHPTARRSAGHHVCFQNLGKVDRTLTLSKWPFKGTPRDILVPAGATVGQFQLDPDSDFVGVVTAKSNPPFDPGGPGDPGFDVDG